MQAAKCGYFLANQPAPSRSLLLACIVMLCMLYHVEVVDVSFLRKPDTQPEIGIVVVALVGKTSQNPGALKRLRSLSGVCLVLTWRRTSFAASCPRHETASIIHSRARLQQPELAT